MPLSQCRSGKLRLIACGGFLAILAACGGGSGSSASQPVAVAPPAPAALPPAAPGGLEATAGNTQVSLSWTANAMATSYHIKRATVAGGPYTSVAAPAVASYMDTSVVNGTTYFYVASSIGSAGESADSSQVSATPVAPAQIPAPPSALSAVAVTVTVNATSVHAISPYVYGVNGISEVSGLTLNRQGGNRLTAYNWETNASNAGSDYLYENDAGMSSSATPADGISTVISTDQAAGRATIVTFQMQGLVAGDVNGPVSVASAPDLSRFKTVVAQKSSKSSAAFSATPPTTDANVYMDEFAWALDKRFGGQNIFGASPTTQRVFAQLDNEPELWNTTHLEVQGSTAVSSDTYISKTIALATALKTQFPDLLVFGPVHYGFYGIYAWNGELAPTPTGNNWFPDKYLPAIKSASATFGRPLVDVYDFHWYPEATDGSGNRITGLNDPNLTDAQIQAIVQSPRSLWDTTYTENSWITQTLGGPIYILGRLQSRITSENPGMKLSITEYNNGGAQHIAGTIAQADNLGVFGAEGLFAANLWSLVSTEPYLLAGFRAFRNFDGASHHFGDTSVQATSSNTAIVAAYVSTDSTRPGRVVIVAINRSASAQVTVVSGQSLAGTAHLYQMTATSAKSQSTIAPVAAGTMAVSGTSLTVDLPALSVTTIDIY